MVFHVLSKINSSNKIANGHRERNSEIKHILEKNESREKFFVEEYLQGSRRCERKKQTKAYVAYGEGSTVKIIYELADNSVKMVQGR